MRKTLRIRPVYTGILTSLLLVSSTVYATNGMKMTSYGVRYGGMGGASMALGGSVLDLEANPSQMSRQKDDIFEFGINYLYPMMTYEDEFTPVTDKSFKSLGTKPEEMYYHNKINGDPEVMDGVPGFPLPFIGFRKRISDHMVFGLALYAEGGGGAKFDGVLRHTPNRQPLGSVLQGMGKDLAPATSKAGEYIPKQMGEMTMISENLRSFMALMRLTPGIAYSLGKLHLGAGVDLNIAKMDWSWTFSDAAGMMELPGTGYRYKSDVATAASGKLGFTYDLTEKFAFAYSYQSTAKLDLNGKFNANSGHPFYPRDTKVSTEMIWPESHNFGIAYKFADSFVMAFDVNYIKWSNIMNTYEFHLDAPVMKLPTGHYTNNLAFNMKWVDQPVYKLGFEYKPGKVAYRIGHNYGRSPATEEGINPLFPVVTENHSTVGVGVDASEKLTVDFALEYAYKNSVKGSSMTDWTMMHTMAVNQVCDYPDCGVAQARGEWLPNYSQSLPFSESFLASEMFKYKVSVSQINTQFSVTYKI